jgi:multicomponent Na+:H+ antiporter subunit G
MSQTIIAIILTLGAIFVLLAAIGVVKMPDLFLRISVTTKAATLGVGLMLIGVIIHFGDFYTTTRSIAIVLFIFLTAPIGAHLIGRAAYIVGVPLWKNNRIDQLAGHYNKSTRDLHSEKIENPLEREETQTLKDNQNHQIDGNS